MTDVCVCVPWLGKAELHGAVDYNICTQYWKVNVCHVLRPKSPVCCVLCVCPILSQFVIIINIRLTINEIFCRLWHFQFFPIQPSFFIIPTMPSILRRATEKNKIKRKKAMTRAAAFVACAWLQGQHRAALYSFCICANAIHSHGHMVSVHGWRAREWPPM